MAEQVPPGWREKIFHATLTVGDTVLMGGDHVPEQYEQPKGFSVVLGIDDPVDAERIFHSLAENGTVQMPFQETFWAVGFGTLVDQFGIPWTVNCEQAPSAG
jgi:PhnB protein